jgi:hypothetical protein
MRQTNTGRFEGSMNEATSSYPPSLACSLTLSASAVFAPLDVERMNESGAGVGGPRASGEVRVPVTNDQVLVTAQRLAGTASVCGWA